LLRRPFSIHRVSDDGSFQILYKVVGKGTKMLSALQTGQTIGIVGPLGNGFVVPAGTEGVCLVGGGLGTAPLCFLADCLCREGMTSRVRILLGARNAAELAAVTDSFKDIGFDILLATDDGSCGHHGYVADLMDLHLSSDIPWKIYTCGPRPMMAAVAAKSRAKGFSCHVSLETMMACGIGACLGCIVEKEMGRDDKYLHVCSDGPVFDAAGLKW
jgi:dihydroorotate dehydrogenase electron transfer subunit